ncbi:uncharacterized protein J8A68_002091 [[Candida] subhashii]|uniref:Thioredoxin domain-containing protein n=1 Tax=[Candida] subhashii TaxID=561895 RepID=A0A8J5QLK1_9ASCO|nr:uncharacterized protein J8A68_002091 [[Candida] subhashii]KAG7664378.1 hypothetical protein J8A68_002091 [[Candida] subhashii]
MLQLKSKKEFFNVLEQAEDDSSMIVVDFFDKCGHCKEMNHQLDEFQYQYRKRNVKFFKVNIDEDDQLASDYIITSIPTTLFFKDGKLVNKVVGARPDQVRNILETED